MLFPEIGHNGFLLTVAGLATATTLLVCAIIKARFERSYAARTVLNKSERSLFTIIERTLSGIPSRPRLLCQVCYGEFLSSPSKRAFWRINAKRADFLIVDREFKPLAVIEYQGRGHYGSNRKTAANAKARDRIKRQACVSAGIPWIEIPASYDADGLRAELVALLCPPPPQREKEETNVRGFIRNHAGQNP
ncbi:DUF2726 domain-containing protein [Pseudomonas sp. GX19020]|uniref:DUF2726 domain-containing protein n=1 Tax=Pseudomonas sp. GX19020 TaxID=2942277 RepID=UPI00201A03F7|nr:DUF2726 domain-containing protein [Pseudomonas sp. GX19020]MCL4068169.1 DUF2726 domain-containing protein [Pseudomonas sp. GX19020]